MKKYILIFLFSIISFGIANAKYAEEPENTIPSLKNEEEIPVGASFLLRPLLLGKMVRISVWLEDEKQGEFKQYSTMVREAYQAWFDNAVKHITASGRAEEFKDILPYLKRPVSLEILHNTKETLTQYDTIASKTFLILFYETLESYQKSGLPGVTPDSAGMCSSVYNLIAMSREGTLEQQKFALCHEVGHSLGFADQYFPVIGTGDAVFASHSTENIMGGEPDLTCDDADGLINLADRILGLRSRGGKEGWKSLCPDSSERYKEGVSTKTDRYRVHVRAFPNYDIIRIEEYENSRNISTEEFEMVSLSQPPFHFVEEVSAVKKDSENRPALMKGKNGEDVYVTGISFRIEKVITKNGKLLSYFVRDFNKDSAPSAKQYFQVKGSYGHFEGVINEDAEPLSATYTQNMAGGEKAILTLYFEKTDDNRLSYTAQWQGPWEQFFKGISKKSSNNPQGKLDFAIWQQQIEQGLFYWGTNWFAYSNS